MLARSRITSAHAPMESATLRGFRDVCQQARRLVRGTRSHDQRHIGLAQERSGTSVIAGGDGHDLTKCSTVKGLGETGRRDRDIKLPPGDKRPRLMQSRPAARSALDNRGSTPDLPLTTRNGSLYSRSFASRACNRGRSQSIATSSTDMSLNPTTSIPSRSAARCNRATTSAYGLPNSTTP